MPTNKKHFEFTILGCSGGPISGKTCSFLIKPADIQYDDILQDSNENDCLLAIDAGTGLTSLIDILNENHKVGEVLQNSFIIDLYPETETDSVLEAVSRYTNLKNMEIKAPFDSLKKSIESKRISNFQLADKILNSINCYLITHSHLDHVTSLVINSPAFNKPKTIYGIRETIDSIKNNLFNDFIWPDLVSMGIIELKYLSNRESNPTVSKRYDVTPFELSHGKDSKNSKIYKSSSFLINDKLNDYNLLIFGDVESDLSSNLKWNQSIWNHIAPLIIHDKLNTIIIECSTIDKRPPLFGHMTPSNLFYEFLKLRKTCIDLKFPDIKTKNLDHDNKYYETFEYQPLSNFNIIIIHVKETLDDKNPRSLILKKLNTLDILHNTQINFTIALSGLSLLL